MRRAQKKFALVSDDAVHALSSGWRMNFGPLSKKVCERAEETGHAFFMCRASV
jgi:hypothetical protein